MVLCNERAKQGFVRRQAEVRIKSLLRESIRFIDKQSHIAERKTVGEQGPGDRSKEA